MEWAAGRGFISLKKQVNLLNDQKYPQTSLIATYGTPMVLMLYLPPS